MPSKVKIRSGQCYWCRERDADSREHKFKRSDLVREHGRGELRGERTIIRVGGSGERETRSTRSDVLKFTPSLCTQCNNARSQPADRAYDRFIEWILANEKQVLADRRVDLEAIFGPTWPSESENVHRYFVKHALCRIVESHPGPGDVELPADALAFLDGDALPESLACNFWIEPTWLRFIEKGEGDPLWVRPMGMDPIYKEASGRIAGRSYYGWLAFGWEFWAEGSGYPFHERYLPLPILATRSVELEFALTPNTSPGPDASEEENQRWVQKISGGEVIVPPGTLSCSAVGQKFIGGALDFEASLRGLAPDEREVLVEDPPPSAQTEVVRVGLLCEIARHVWSKCSIDIDKIQAVELTEALLEPVAIQDAVALLQAGNPKEGWPEICNGLAAMASLKTIEAYEAGVESEAGWEALLAASSLAGGCAAASGAANEDWPAGWDSVSAAAARIARVG
jgi:hypothetical protein